jgi:DNA excision repair protein ERCC-3
MDTNTSKPLVVQGDGTIFLEVESDPDRLCRDKISRFAELIKSPEHIHTYRITPLAVWNAASTGISLDEMINTLSENSKYDVPSNIMHNIQDWYRRYGRVKLVKLPPDGNAKFDPEYIYIISDDRIVLEEIANRKTIQNFLDGWEGPKAIRVRSIFRGRLKQALIKVSYPVEDLVGFLPGDPLDFSLAERTSTGEEFRLRSYQKEAIESFLSGGDGSRSGVIVLPSGAGKTVVGMGAMERIRENTLIITTGTVAVRQWIREITDKSTVDPLRIGEYTGDSKEIQPITVTTYQILTHSTVKSAAKSLENDDFGDSGDLSEGDITKIYPHLNVFMARNWGLIIYDEVHLLPAPVFRITSEIQAKKRLGLTATLIREDGKEDDVFSLIGPKKYDAPWKDLERDGWIATAVCSEVRVKFPNEQYMMEYAVAPQRLKYRIAAENPVKINALKSILQRLSPEDSVLIIGDYLDQLQKIADMLNVPIITGKTKNSIREELYSQFRRGDINMLVVSKVANYAIDLPDANVAIQVSGTFGSRQEEAQRLGRILRPKSRDTQAYFYTIVTSDTLDQEYSMRRQLFLTERGYGYTIINQEDIISNVSVGGKNA